MFWDLKFGIEAEAWRARYTEVATTQPEVLASAERVLWLAEQRAAILKQLGRAATSPKPTELGVHLRRVYVLVDEVAELAHDHDRGRTADRVLRELLRIVQLVRAMGIHVILCGQRFGSDLGKHVTSIRAQVSGRICLQVNDPQTAEMVLAGCPPRCRSWRLTLNRPGHGDRPGRAALALRPLLLPVHRRGPRPGRHARRQADQLGRAGPPTAPPSTPTTPERRRCS